MSPNTVARLFNYQKPNNKLPSCDADTVRLMKAFLIDGAGIAHCIYSVQWLEGGHKHKRDFRDQIAATRYSLQLTCRLEIDALNREAARKAQGRASIGTEREAA